ncbi:unnamed protein product [Rhizophagus irregularis]|nr:unnamed protein product [Rhizophagus irregularis]
MDGKDLLLMLPEVSYHGTEVDNANQIARDGFRNERGVRFAYGTGIYSSPEISIAEGYATQFERQNARWKVVFQNRINPVRLSKYNNTWLVPDDDDIRPYGLCIKRHILGHYSKKIVKNLRQFILDIKIIKLSDTEHINISRYKSLNTNSLPELALIDTIFSLFIIIIINYINRVNKFYILCLKTS